VEKSLVRMEGYFQTISMEIGGLLLVKNRVSWETIDAEIV